MIWKFPSFMTGREVFEAALAVINERDSTGEYHEDVQDYEKNAPSLINLLISRLWADNCIVMGIDTRQWKYTDEKIKGLDDEIPLHPSFLFTLSLALASLLIHEEDASRAAYYYTLFMDSRANLVSSFSHARKTGIRDVYS